MKKKYSLKKSTKIMIALSVLSLVLTILLTVGMVFLFENGILAATESIDVVLRNQKELLMDRYSVWALTDADRNYNMDAIQKTNLHLGVMKSDTPDFDTEKLKDIDLYEVNNFDKNFDLEKAHIFQTYTDRYTGFSYDMSSIWGKAQIWHEQNDVVEASSLDINGFYYDWMTDKLYIQADNGLFLYDGDYGYSDGEDLDEGLQGEMFRSDEVQWKHPEDTLVLYSYNYQIPFSEIEIVSDMQLRDLNCEISKEKITDIDAGKLTVRRVVDGNGSKKTYYCVVSYLNDPLVGNGQTGFFNSDLFLQAEAVYGFLYHFKSVILVCYVLSILLISICAIYWFIKAFALIVSAFAKLRIMWKLGLVLLALFVSMLFWMALGGFGDAIIALFYLFILCPFVIYIGWEYRKQAKACEELAKGNLDAKVDTKNAIWDLKRQDENINAISESISLAVDEQMKAERMKAELITNVSHDIKTPLTSIINYVDLLSKENIESEQAREYIEVLSRQSDKLKKLIVDLIEASKASTGNLEINAELCDARMALLQVVGEYEEKMKNAGIELVLNVPEESAMIMADGRYLFRIFDNLMVNIQKYALENTRAYIDLRADEKSVALTFKNISREALNVSGDELAERFFRGDSSRNTDGNGLGLAIVKSLTELMQGELRILTDGDLFKAEVCFPATGDGASTGDGAFVPTIGTLSRGVSQCLEERPNDSESADDEED